MYNDVHWRQRESGPVILLGLLFPKSSIGIHRKIVLTGFILFEHMFTCCVPSLLNIFFHMGKLCVRNVDIFV